MMDRARLLAHRPVDMGLIAADLFSCLGDRPQVGPILRGYAGRVGVVRQLLESVGGGLIPGLSARW